ncbi:ankyrin repeat-containing domain protein [Mycena galopus ATCC 62051]|nr:ankyrin repeat-containing domain protein [Mycena galopus ATCC 62051]
MPAACNDMMLPADINYLLTQTTQHPRIGIDDLLKSANSMSAPAAPLQAFNNNSDSGQRTTSRTSGPDRVVVITNVSGGRGGAGGIGGREGGIGGVGEGPSFQATNMHVMVQKQSVEDREILNWTSPINFFPRQADILGARQSGTGDWFLQENLFKQWKACEIRALWCRGMPGAGKTVLASIVVDYLQANLADEKAGIAVLYLDHKATEIQAPTNLIAALWHQLACERPVSSRVHDIYKKHYPRGTRPSLEEVDCVLRCVISEFHWVFIVVDALDEYPEGPRNTLLRNLRNLGPPVRLMLTSRPHINIDHIFPNIECLEVRANEEDIRKYLEGQIQESDRLSRHIQKSPTLRELIEDKIVKRSDGMFLLAKLHIDSLVNKLNVAAVHDSLNKLSTNLHGAYHEIVERIDRASEEERQLAWRTLSWVLNAKAPLRRPQLQAALAIEPDSTELNPNRQTDIDLILSLCAGLVVIDKVDDKVRLIHYTTQTYLQDHVHTSMFPRPPSEIPVTCFTYMSLVFKVFSHLLRNEFLLFTYNPFLHYTVEYCLVHARGQPEVDIKHEILAFLANCTVWWRLWNWKHGGQQSPPDKLWIALAFHLEQISSHIIQQDGAGNLLQKAASRGAIDIVRILLRKGVGEETEGGALQEAVMHGHEEIVSLLLVHDAEKESQGCNGTALQGNGNTESVDPKRVDQVSGNPELRNRYGAALYQASWIGNEAMVMLLIQHGADINADGGEYGTATTAAAAAGHVSVLKLLTDHGADTNAKGGSALEAAVWKRYEAIVEVLLEHGADVNAGGGKYGGALQLASRQGFAAMVQLLLKHGADINAEGGEYGTALQLAFRQHDKTIIDLLLKHGADISTEGKEYTRALQAVSLLRHGAEACLFSVGRDYSSVLQAASWMGHAAMVALLLKNSLNANTGAEYGSALQVASERGHEAVVKLLLEHGADPDPGEDGSALQAASKGGREAVVKLLLEHGADVNAGGWVHGGWVYRSTLWAASEGGHEAVVKLLLTHGAHVHTRGGEDRNGLEAASKGGHEAVVKLLLEHGADANAGSWVVDINAGGWVYGSALQAASVGGHEAVVKLLLESGADIDTIEDCSLLQAASKGGREAIVKLFLEHGADVNAGSWMYGSALQAASVGGHDTIVKLLLEHGADVNAGGWVYGDWVYRSALWAASQGGHEAIVKLLLRHGTHVHTRGGEDSNALEAASKGGHEAVVKLLLKHGANVNTGIWVYRSALQAASAGGHDAIVKLLLNNILNKLLLEHGANINTGSWVDGSAWQAAFAGGHEAIVELLLKNILQYELQ